MLAAPSPPSRTGDESAQQEEANSATSPYVPSPPPAASEHSDYDESLDPSRFAYDGTFDSQRLSDRYGELANGESLDLDLPGTLHPPDSKHSGGLGLLPILLLGFLGCFLYQNWRNSRPQRTRTSDQEEGVGLMDFCRPGRTGSWGNRTSDMIDRRRDPGLAANDFSRTRNHDDDDDGML